MNRHEEHSNMTPDSDSSDASNELVEKWGCHDCGHTDTAPFDEVAGRPIRKTVGQGRRETVIETAVCPECYSEDWHSESVSKALLNREIPDE
jgi:Zn ribbon nucleic-acid-binding protein